jgi:hypothetical protein
MIADEFCRKCGTCRTTAANYCGRCGGKFDSKADSSQPTDKLERFEHEDVKETVCSRCERSYGRFEKYWLDPYCHVCRGRFLRVLLKGPNREEIVDALSREDASLKNCEQMDDGTLGYVYSGVIDKMVQSAMSEASEHGLSEEEALEAIQDRVGHMFPCDQSPLDGGQRQETNSAPEHRAAPNRSPLQGLSMVCGAFAAAAVAILWFFFHLLGAFYRGFTGGSPSSHGTGRDHHSESEQNWARRQRNDAANKLARAKSGLAVIEGKWRRGNATDNELTSAKWRVAEAEAELYKSL